MILLSIGALALALGPKTSGGVTPVELELELSRLAEAHLWPGFEPLDVPLAVWDGERTWLFRHPAPPPEFEPSVADGASGAHVAPGRHAALTANSSAELGGAVTATVLLAELDRDARSLAALALHESFHVHQRVAHPTWGGNEADLFLYPSEDAELLALRRFETEALRRAVETAEPDDASCWAREALAWRTERYAALGRELAAYERGTELNEGLATYVERRAIDAPHGLAADGYAPDAVRKRAYDTGDALARLLDRFAPGWRGELERDGTGSLDERLASALGAEPRCELTNEVEDELRERARADAAVEAERVARRLAEFEALEGARLAIELADGVEPLRLRGFDPLNVVRAGGRVLHTRFLNLASARGSVELIGCEALSEAAGEHPLFDGVRRLEIAGCGPFEPSVEGDVVRIETDTLQLELRGVAVSRDGDTWLVTLRR